MVIEGIVKKTDSIIAGDGLLHHSVMISIPIPTGCCWWAGVILAKRRRLWRRENGIKGRALMIVKRVLTC